MQPLQKLNMNSIIDFNQLTPTTHQVVTRFEPDFGVLWYLMQPKPRPCFNKTGLKSLLQRQTALVNTLGQIEYQEALHQVN